MRKYFLKLLNQRWKVISDSAPQDIEVNVKISVYEAVSHANNIPPRNIRKIRSGLISDIRRCFPNDLNRLNHGKNKFSIPSKRFARLALNKGNSLPCRIDHMLNSNLISLLHTAPQPT